MVCHSEILFTGTSISSSSFIQAFSPSEWGPQTSVAWLVSQCFSNSSFHNKSLFSFHMVYFYVNMPHILFTSGGVR
jgi:hypothetical protein